MSTLPYKIELMKSYEPLLAVDGKNKDSIRSIFSGEHSEVSHLFSLGNDSQLYAIIHNSGDSSSPNGWTKSTITRHDEVGEGVAFDVYQSKLDGQFSIAFASKRNDTFEVYISPLMDNSKLDTIFTNSSPKNVFFFKTKYALTDATIEEVTSVSHHTDFTLVSVRRKGNTQSSYYLLSNQTEHMVEYLFPEQADVIHSLKIGSVFGTAGVFGLYSMNTENRLTFQGFPDEVYHKTLKYRYVPKQGTSLTCFSLVQDENGDSIVFTGGESIEMFKSPEVDSEVVYSSTKENPLKATDLFVGTRDDKKSFSVYILDEYASLHYKIYQSSATQDDKWNVPIKIYSNVGAVTCVVGKSGLITDHLFYVENSGALNYCYHDDSDSKLWRQGRVVVGDTGVVTERQHYSVQIMLNPVDISEDLKVPADTFVNITTSSSTYLTVNNASYIVGPSKAGVVKLTSTQDSLSITYDVFESFSAPILTVSGQRIPQNSLTIDLSEEISGRMKDDLSSSDKFKNAKRQNGKPLITQPLSDGTLKAVTSAANTLISTADSFSKEKSTNVHANNLLLRTNVKKSVESNQAQHVFGLSFGSEPETGCPCVTYHDKDQVHEHFKDHFSKKLLVSNNSTGIASATASEPAETSFWEDLGHAFGAIAQYVEEAFDKLKKFFLTIVDGAYHLIISIADQILTCIITSAEQLVHAVMWAFEKISLAIHDVIEWVGFIFSWDDIIRTKEIVKKGISQMIEKVPSFLTTLQKQINLKLDTCKNNLANKIFQQTLDSETFKNKTYTSEKKTADDNNQGSDPDPRVNWIQGKMNHAQTWEKESTGEEPKVDEIKTSYDGAESVFSRMEQDAKSFMKGELSFSTFMSTLMNSIGLLFVEGAQELSNISFKFLTDHFSYFHDFLTGSINIPFFSALYKTIADSDLSILDLLCLLFAIPFTIAHKIILNVRPFDSDGGEKFISDLMSIFSIVGNGGTSRVSLFAASSSVESTTSSEPLALRSYHIGSGVIRLLRCATIAGFTGFLLGKFPKMAAVCQTIDFFLRLLNSIFDLMRDGSDAPTKRHSAFFDYFLIAFIVQFIGCMQALEQNPVFFVVEVPFAKKFNVLVFLDSIALTINGIWQAIDVATISNQSKPIFSSRVCMSIFLMLCPFSFICNTAATEIKNEVPKYPWALPVATIFGVARVGFMLASGVSELCITSETA